MIRTLAFGQADRRVASLLGDMDIAAVRQAMFECPPPPACTLVALLQKSDLVQLPEYLAR